MTESNEEANRLQRIVEKHRKNLKAMERMGKSREEIALYVEETLSELEKHRHKNMSLLEALQGMYEADGYLEKELPVTLTNTIPVQEDDLIVSPSEILSLSTDITLSLPNDIAVAQPSLERGEAPKAKVKSRKAKPVLKKSQPKKTKKKPAKSEEVAEAEAM